MKKILFLLLCTVSIYGQTTTSQEQEFDYGIKNNSTQTITTPPYLTTTGMDGTQGKIPSALIEKTDNKQNSLAVDGTGTKYPTVTAVNTGLALKALDSNVVHKTGIESISGDKTFNATVSVVNPVNSEQTVIFENGTLKLTTFDLEAQATIDASLLTTSRSHKLPDDSGTIALISQTVTNGVTTSGPSQDAVYDFVTANAVTLGTTNGLSLSGQQISLGLSSTSTIGALSSTDWNVFNNKQNNLVSGTSIKTLEGQSLLGSGNIDLAKSDVGLSNVDNTSDANKPVSTAQQTALNLKENSFAKNTAFNKNFGTTAGTVAGGNDSRFTDARIPLPNSSNYIQNQNASAQSANMWINGSIKAGAATFASTVTAPTFIGSLSGNASSASNATAFGGFPYGGVYSSGALYYSTLFNSTSNEFQLADQSATRTFLGLGSNAYSSTAFLPLSGGALSGIVTAPTAAPGTTGNQIATLDFALGIRPYKVYTALLSQTGTNAPTAIVLENTLGGTVVWGRSNAGFYTGTLTNAFPPGKTFYPPSSSTWVNENVRIYNYISNTSQIRVDTYFLSANSDGILNNNTIEIRVYN